jgi:hypothetical protein
MKRVFLLLLFFALTTLTITAQTYPEDFIVPLAIQKTNNSLYKTINFIDTRPTDGMLNKKGKNITAVPIATQLTSLLQSATDSTAVNGELLLQLRLLNFAEVKGTKEEGNCYLRAILYTKVDGRYKKINSIDTVVAIQTGVNLNKYDLENGGKILSEFVTNNLLNLPIDSTSYSLYDIRKLDSLEKQKLALYTRSKYTDGLYISYQSFKDQIPDKQIIAKIGDTGKLYAIRMIDNGEKKHINPKEAYAIVYNGVPYVITKYGYYQIGKNNNDFFFTGDIPMLTDPTDMSMGYATLGLLGGALTSLPNEEVFYMRIDHINGRFIRLKKLIKPAGQFYPGF